MENKKILLNGDPSQAFSDIVKSLNDGVKDDKSQPISLLSGVFTGKSLFFTGERGEKLAGEYYVNELIINDLVAKVFQIVDDGKCGRIQSIDLSLNCEESILIKSLVGGAYLGFALIGDKVKNVTQEESERGFKHGFIVYEFENGALLRIMYSTAPCARKEYYHIYGDGGELRLDLADNSALYFPQIPDYAGDEIKLDLKGSQFLNEALKSRAIGRLSKVFLPVSNCLNS